MYVNDNHMALIFHLILYILGICFYGFKNSYVSEVMEQL